MKHPPLTPVLDFQPEIEDYAKILGECIRQRFSRLGLTQEQFAKKAGLSRTGLHYLVNAVRKPGLDSVLRCCMALNISPVELLAEVDRCQTQRRLARLAGCSPL